MGCHHHGSAFALSSSKQGGQLVLLFVVEPRGSARRAARVCGEATRIAASATRWRWPTLRSRGSRSATSPSPNRRSSSASATASGGMRGRGGVNASSAVTVSLNSSVPGPAARSPPCGLISRAWPGACPCHARHLTLVRFQKAHQVAQQRALAGAIAPHQGDELTGAHLEADPAQRLPPAVGVRQLADRCQWSDAIRRGRRSRRHGSRFGAQFGGQPSRVGAPFLAWSGAAGPISSAAQLHQRRAPR